jgi:hypothetical protein
MGDFLKLFLGHVLSSKDKNVAKKFSIEYLAFLFCVLVVVMVWHLLFSQQLTITTKTRCDVNPDAPSSKVADNSNKK